MPDTEVEIQNYCFVDNPKSPYNSDYIIDIVPHLVSEVTFYFGGDEMDFDATQEITMTVTSLKSAPKIFHIEANSIGHNYGTYDRAIEKAMKRSGRRAARFIRAHTKTLGVHSNSDF